MNIAHPDKKKSSPITIHGGETLKTNYFLQNQKAEKEGLDGPCLLCVLETDLERHHPLIIREECIPKELPLINNSPQQPTQQGGGMNRGGNFQFRLTGGTIAAD